MNAIALNGKEDENKFHDIYHLSYLGTTAIKKVDLHRHEFFEIIFFINGSMEYIVDQHSYELDYGDLLIIPPSIPHEAKALDNVTPYRRYVLWVTLDFMERLIHYDASMMFLFQTMKTRKSYQVQVPQKEMTRLIHILSEIMEYQHTQDFGYASKCRSMLYDLFYVLNFTLYHDAHDGSPPKTQEIYLQIANYIKNNLTNDLSLDTLAKEFYMSKYHMLHVFKEKMSISIHKYIVIRRLEFGKSLMLTGTPISKLHTHCGFKDYATFYRAFKKRYGMSPKQYYKSHRQPLFMNGSD